MPDFRKQYVILLKGGIHTMYWVKWKMTILFLTYREKCFIFDIIYYYIFLLLHLDLEPMVYDCGSSTLLLHRNCVSTYTSKTHIKRFLSRQNRTTDEPVVNRTCRSDISPFNLKEHCLI